MERILLLEDDKSLVTGLTLALGRAGYALDTARTLAEAGHLWQAGRYDLLMLDVTLPDGTVLTEAASPAETAALERAEAFNSRFRDCSFPPTCRW